MRSLRFAFIAALMVTNTAFASPTDPKNGVDYQTLSAPQPVQATGKKVEVIEFFAYHCPACNALEPTLNQWIKKQVTTSSCDASTCRSKDRPIQKHTSS